MWPWHAAAQGKSGSHDDASLLAAWRKYYGDMDDPEVQKRIEATAAAIMASDKSQGRKK